ncbi:DsrE family protein [Maridesulfovibrio bastinii]|uniref:DsrE family protein n=1 Tax=Maridesulfovibrio bastinii TaxID=47157 RepID=UPI000400797E|nr:DsrE family protein [Maridesulfovibrio bastinii]
MENDRLNILWTNADPVTSELMVLMYAKASAMRGWWKHVRVIIWGATAQLASSDENIRSLIAEAQNEGVEFSACEACADRLDVKQSLLDLGIEVIFWGDPLTKLIKSNEKLLTV